MAASASETNDVIVSFDEADRATAEDIAAKLRDAGIQTLLAPLAWEVRRWHTSLYRAVSYCSSSAKVAQVFPKMHGLMCRTG